MRKAAIISLALVMGTCSRPPTALEEVLASGQLRVITRNSPTTYYRDALGYDGPEYQLVHGFATYLTAKYKRVIDVDFITVDRFTELLPSLRHGNTHLAAAGLTVTTERAKDVAFGPTYQTVQQQLIYRLNNKKPKNIADIDDKHLEIMAGSSFVDTLHDIRQLSPELSWTENPDTEISELLVAVEKQKIDYTVADSNEFAVHRFYMPDLRVAINLKENDELAWAFRPFRSAALRAEVDKYFSTIKHDGTLEQILDRYYGHTDRFDYVGTRTFIRHYESRYEPYRELFRGAGAETQTDWRLLAAIGYQESHWNPNAVSPTGVRGLMQLTQITASSLGVANREDPVEAIPGGARYFAKLRKRMSDIPEPDRTWFALAAYNVGYSHLKDARTLTKRSGGDPDRWLDVEKSLPLLAIRKWYSTVPNGYARGWEPVQYVRNIRTYYEILNWLSQDEQDNAAEPPADILPPVQTASEIKPVLSWF